MSPEKTENVALLARVVMGWADHEFQDTVSEMQACIRCDLIRTLYTDSQSQLCFSRQGWDPYANTADAMEILGMFRHWLLSRGPDGYSCSVSSVRAVDHDSPVGELTIGDAICTACLEWARAQKRGGA